jgi:hypothetical protein
MSMKGSNRITGAVLLTAAPLWAQLELGPISMFSSVLLLVVGLILLVGSGIKHTREDDKNDR